MYNKFYFIQIYPSEIISVRYAVALTNLKKLLSRSTANLEKIDWHI